MRNVSRALLAAASILPLSLAPAPAHATPGGIAVFAGSVHVGCFGCGTYGPLGNSADLTALGVALTGNLIVGTVTSTRTVSDTNEGFTVLESAPCPLVGNALGVTDGAIRVSFYWNRVGGTAVITTTGDIDGAAVAGFVITNPAGNPCGGPVDAVVYGMVAGT